MPPLTAAEAYRRRDCLTTEPKQFGNLHERAMYLLSVAGRMAVDQDLLHAIHDLVTEASFYDPVSPPFGVRPVVFRGRQVSMDYHPVADDGAAELICTEAAK